MMVRVQSMLLTWLPGPTWLKTTPFNAVTVESTQNTNCDAVTLRGSLAATSSREARAQKNETKGAWKLLRTRVKVRAFVCACVYVCVFGGRPCMLVGALGISQSASCVL